MSVLINFFKIIDRSAAVRALSVALVLVLTLGICGFDAKCDSIRENVLRLHILANSDDEEDQQLKFKVRDALLEVSEKVFSVCLNEEEAAAAAAESLDLLQLTAQQTVYELGYSYPVTVEIADTWFETRHYENFALPAGTYEALRVVIGKGEGHNWWCVMFPAVCLPAAKAVNSGFSDVLDDGTVEIVESPKRYKAQFKVVEIFEKTRSKLAKWFG